MNVSASDQQLQALKARLETLQCRLESVRAGRRVLMELLASQLEEKRRLTRRLQDTERRLRRSNLRCLRMEAGQVQTGATAPVVYLRERE